MDMKPIFSDSEYKSRISNLQEKTKDLDLTLILGRADLFYYSGFGLDGFIAIDGNITRYVQRNYDLGKELSSIHTKPMDSFRVFKELASETNPKTLGLELDRVPYKTVEYISRAFEKPKIVDISTTLRQIRSVKSNAEQEIMRQAADQTDRSFVYMTQIIKPGMSELELSADLDCFLRKEGHPGWMQIRKFDHNQPAIAYVMAGESTRSLNSSFGPVSGAGVGLYHMTGPSRRKFRDGDAVIVDTTGNVEGYTSDETRTYFMGNVDQKFRDAYDLAKQVHERIGNIMIAGNKPHEVYENILEFVTEFDRANHFMGLNHDRVKFVGHGVGLELDEFPILTSGYKDTLQEGQFVAVEPKFVFENPVGGVGIEDVWLVKSGKSEKITKTPWDLTE